MGLAAVQSGDRATNRESNWMPVLGWPSPEEGWVEAMRPAVRAEAVPVDRHRQVRGVLMLEALAQGLEPVRVSWEGPHHPWQQRS